MVVSRVNFDVLVMKIVDLFFTNICCLLRILFEFLVSLMLRFGSCTGTMIICTRKQDNLIEKTMTKICVRSYTRIVENIVLIVFPIEKCCLPKVN